MDKLIFAVCQIRDGVLTGASREVIGAAKTLGSKVRAVVFEDAADTGAYGAETLRLTGAGEEPDGRGRLLAEAIRGFQPFIVLAPATGEGRAVCSIAAALCQTGLTADCTGLEQDENGYLISTRPAMGGGLIAEIVCTAALPQMATLRPGVFPAAERTDVLRPTEYFSGEIAFQGAELIRRIPSREDRSRLLMSRVVVAGGLGVGSKEGFAVIAELAKALGGSPAASRGAVNAGFAPYSMQVGLSGVSVSPDVYIALGISGAAQHLAGIRGAKKIIAVNNDRSSPIFRFADLGVTADWREYAEALLQELRK